MYPAVRNYGDYNKESFDEYYRRWPSALGGIPKGIVEDWIYRHWSDFEEYWMSLQPQNWLYELVQLDNSAVLSIGHVGSWIPELDAEGVEYVGNFPRAKTRLARFMTETGTFPVPIIVARMAGSIVHPRSGGETMKEPFQLIEGHNRLACIRGMINSNHPHLLNSHSVWVATIAKDKAI